MKKIILAGLLIFTLLSMESCKTTVTERPAQPAVVARPPQPRPDYIWIEGDWYRSGGRYQFRQGYWAPPHHGRTWAAGQWAHTKKGWYYQKGHWR